VLLEAWARHGLALALYALARWPEAEKLWAELATRRLPTALQRDVLFWHGEALGRAGQLERADDELRTFIQGGPHALLAVGHVRRGWWLLTAGRPAEAAPAFRAFLMGSPPSVGDPARERDWAEGGLALALVATGDTAGARAALRGLDTRRVPLTMAVRVRLAARALEGGRADEAQALAQELLAGALSGPLRAWVLAVKGDAHRAEGDRDEARTQFDLARQAYPGSAVARYAAFRLAQMNFELREFSQAAADLAPLLAAPADPGLRLAALLLSGEAAYQAGDFATAAEAYRRALVEFPDHPQAPSTRLALGWTALRRDQRDVALRQFLDFARIHTADPRAADGLILAAELMLAAGSLDDAREVLDRILTAHPTSPRTEFARFNRILIAARAGDTEIAQRALRAWIVRAPFPALIGRAWTALGATLLGAGRAADAGAAFARAVQEGGDAVARLGLGAAALLEERWDDAAREFTAARDQGTPAVAAVAEYGLGAVGLHRGRPADFKTAALAALTTAPRGRPAPRLLYMLVGLAVEDKDWPAALSYARRLAAEYSQDQAADDAFERIVAGAAAAEAWPIVRDAHTLLRQHDPQSPFLAASRLAYARALLEVGRADDARRALEEFVTATPQDPRAWMMLGRAREAGGDRRGAVEAFGRAVQQGASPTTDREGYLAYARALTAERRWDQARPVLERMLGSAEGAVAAEVAVALGETWAAQGDPLNAVEYYMTAAYLEPESLRGRRALLAAGRSFTAAKNPEAAAIVYRKLLAQTGLPADLAETARQALAALRR
jgi:tetratricopeptide (TPR) repeat protein